MLNQICFNCKQKKNKKKQKKIPNSSRLRLLCRRAPLPRPPLPDSPPSTLQTRCQLHHLMSSSIIHHHELLHQFSFPCHHLTVFLRIHNPTQLRLDSLFDSGSFRFRQDISFEWHRAKDKDFLWEYDPGEDGWIWEAMVVVTSGCTIVSSASHLLNRP